MFLRNGGGVPEPGGDVLEWVLFRQFRFASRAHILEELFPRGDASPVERSLKLLPEGLEFHVSENQGRGAFGEALEIVHECLTHFREQRNRPGREVSGGLLVLVRLFRHFNIESIARQVHVFPLHETQFRGDAQATQKAWGPRVKSGMFDIPEPTDSLIHVDNFNRVVWDDAANGAVTPDNALLVTSTLNASRPTGTSMITPGAVVGTLINAGVGYATAGAVGKALGAMNLISPAGQQTLRNIGMWGGMINGIGNAILH